ncbi:MAG: tetratricopeptide repeat protein [Bacteroidota bacterium]
MISLILYLSLINSPSVIKTGDDAFVRQEYIEAISIYESGLNSSQDKSELLWRIARCYISLGDVTKREEREPMYRKAEMYATQAVEADSLNADAHCWRAVSLGYIAIYEGVRAKVAAANEIKRELDIALRLDPDNDVAHSILGTFYRTLGNVGWIEKQLADILLGGLPSGGFLEAEQSLKKAIELAPTIIRHRFELGLLYLDMERPDDAKKVFTEALKYPPLLASDNRRIERMKKTIAGN